MREYTAAFYFSSDSILPEELFDLESPSYEAAFLTASVKYIGIHGDSKMDNVFKIVVTQKEK